MKTIAAKYLLLFTLLCQHLAAQSEFHNIDRFTSEHGIKRQPNDIVEDKYGFIWFGNGDGLFRLDGDRAVEVDVFTASGQVNRHIFRMAYDEAEDQLLLCTRDGLLKYHLPSGKAWKLDPLDYFTKEKLVEEKSLYAYKDRQGDWWVDFHVPGIVRFPAGGGPPQQFSVEVPPGDLSNLSRANTVVFIIQDLFQDSILWGGTRQGLMRINKATGQTRQIFFRHPNPANQDDANPMRHILTHPNGKLYISTWNGGMLEFDPATEQFEQFFVNEKGHDRDGLTNQIEKVLPRNENELYVSRSDEELFVFNLQTREMRHLKSRCGVDYIDRAGNRWNLTPGGIQLYHRQRNGQQWHYFPEEFGVKRVQGILTGNDGKVLIKIKGKGGVPELDPRNGRYELLPFQGRESSPVDGDILVKTTAGILANDLDQLYLMPPGSRQFHKLPHRLPPDASMANTAVLEDGSVFISGSNGYFFWLKPGLEEMVTYTAADVGEPFPGYFSEVLVCPPDKFERPWMKTANGYSIFEPKENRFLHFPYRDNPDNILRRHRDLWPDNRLGRMWCNSSNTLGWIDQEHPEQGMQQRFDTSTGFDLKETWYPMPDDRGRVWFIDQTGVICLDPEAGKLTPLGTHAHMLRLLPDGRMAIGTAQGISIFQPDSVLAGAASPRPYVTWLKAFEKEKHLGANPLSPPLIQLAPDENSFSVGFSAHNFFYPGRFKIAYQLVGADRDWVYPAASVRSTSYSNLAGGDYVFRLKASDVMEHWGEPFEMRIHIGTPWYKTTWAYLLYIALLGLALWAAFLFQKRRYQLKARLEAERVEAQRLKELDQFKSRFFTNITHEFRTPLTVILGMAETLRAGQNGQTAEAAQMIETNGRNLLDLVNQMLDLAKLESGNLRLHPIQADVMLFLRITVQAFSSLAFSKKQHLGFHADPETVVMDFDPKYLRGVVTNLVANAVKFTPEYGSVMVAAKLAGNRLELSVKDSGPGIPEGELDKIFDRFFQVENSAVSTSNDGTGIGLALTRELVQFMGGTIAVSSRAGEGATFKVSLPATQDAPAGTWEEPAPAEVVPMEENLPKDFYEDLPILLVIEDNADLVRYLSTLLRGEYHLLIARNGREGVEKAFEFLPDVVLSDVMMPEMDGLEVCDTLKNDERTSHIPVILLTAKTTVEDRLEGLRRGADAYLEKPFNQEELFVQLKKSVELRRNLTRRFSGKEPPVADEISTDPGLQIEDAFLRKVRQVIEDSLSDDAFDIPRLCRALAMSRAQLHRKLTALTGTSATFFIRSIRLARAKELLATTDLSISEIAYEVGFKDPNYFSRVFAEAFGQSPRETRK